MSQFKIRFQRTDSYWSTKWFRRIPSPHGYLIPDYFPISIHLKLMVLPPQVSPLLAQNSVVTHSPPSSKDSLWHCYYYPNPLPLGKGPLSLLAVTSIPPPKRAVSQMGKEKHWGVPAEGPIWALTCLKVLSKL